MPRRKRPTRPRGSRKGETDITLWDYTRLLHNLMHDPKSVLIFFELAGIGCLAELECWESLKATCPGDVTRIVATAALFGISETPLKSEGRNDD